MPNVLSKLFAGQLGLSLCYAECHELSHTWNPNCFLAILDAFGPSLLFCAKTYGSLYLLKSLVDKGGRVSQIEWRNFIGKTIRSSIFLTATEILFMFWLCIFRRLLGFATWPTISFVNGFAACAISIWIESPHRRAMLVPYLLNLASEAAFRQACARNLCRPIPFGESLLFGISIGLIVFLLKYSKKLSQSNSPYSSSTNFLHSILRQSHAIRPNAMENSMGHQKCGEWKLDIGLATKIGLKNIVVSFSLFSMANIFKNLFTSKKSNKTSIWPSIRLPLFFGTMPFLTQIFSAFFTSKWTTKSNVSTDGQRIAPTNFSSTKFSLPISAALASTLAMAFYWPNNTLALYAFWKMVELFYFHLVSERILPVFRGGSVFAFCLVSSYLLSLAVLEPQALRPSYYKFLCSLTGNRLQLFNRALFDKYFGTNACGLQLNNVQGNIRKLVPPNLLTINPAHYSPLLHF